MLFLMIVPSLVLASNDKGMDYKTFRMMQGEQIFNESDRKEFKGGYLVGGDDIQYFTWEGKVSNRNLYIEVHAGTIKLRIGKKWIIRDANNALSFPGDSKSDFDQYTLPGLYVKSDKLTANTLICIDSIRQKAGGGWPYTYKSGAYVLVDPMGAPILYKMPSVGAACDQLIRKKNGKLAVPKWEVGDFMLADKSHLASPPPSFTVQYYQLEKTGFSKVGNLITGRYLSNEDGTVNDRFTIDH